VLRTRDDGKTFDLDRRQASEQFDALVVHCLSELEAGAKLSMTATEKAQASFISGWAVRLLHASGEYLDAKQRPPHNADLKFFTAALDNAPDDWVIWQALGDSYVGETRSALKPWKPEKAIEAYLRSLGLKPDNSALWYRLYDLLREPHPRDAVAVLRRAAAFDTRNAYPHYRIAGLLLADTPFARFSDSLHSFVRRGVTDYDSDRIVEDILTDPAIEQLIRIGQGAVGQVREGNSKPEFRLPTYYGSTPAMLRPAWEWEYRMPSDDTRGVIVWHTVTMSVAGYARTVARRGEKAEGLMACQDLVDMGAKIGNDIFQKSLPLTPIELGRLNLAKSATATGLSARCDIAKATGDAAELSRYSDLAKKHMAIRGSAYARYW
jgi:hypothetical protein